MGVGGVVVEGWGGVVGGAGNKHTNNLFSLTRGEKGSTPLLHQDSHDHVCAWGGQGVTGAVEELAGLPIPAY